MMAVKYITGVTGVDSLFCTIIISAGFLASFLFGIERGHSSGKIEGMNYILKSLRAMIKKEKDSDVPN